MLLVAVDQHLCSKETVTTDENMAPDDDDLEALRLAALQSLQKKKASSIAPPVYTQYPPSSGSFRSAPPIMKRPRLPPHSGRNSIGATTSANGARFFNGRTRSFRHAFVSNSNLITVKTIDENAMDSPVVNKSAAVPQLILPQDRHTVKRTTDGAFEEDGSSSKFDRYDHSDDDDSSSVASEAPSSDDFDEVSRSPPTPPPQNKETIAKDEADEDDEPAPLIDLKRSNSLDQLMDELEHEIKVSDECCTKTALSAPPPSSPSPPPPAPASTPPVVENTFNMAPLSPRSAAFVLENRKILERRKRRSPSPVMSVPLHRPTRIKERSTHQRQTTATVTEKEPRGGRHAPSRRQSSRERHLAPPRTVNAANPVSEEVLERRRRKFQSNDMVPTDGKIQLRPIQGGEQAVTVSTEQVESKIKFENQVEEFDVNNDDEDDDLFDLNTSRIDQIFSDEDSDDEEPMAEGRFKTSVVRSKKPSLLDSSRKVPIVPRFVQITAKELSKPAVTSRPLTKVPEDKPKLLIANCERTVINVETENRNSKKRSSPERLLTPMKRTKIDVEPMTDVVVKKATTISETVRSNEGDLRAQLSRKRAERQQKERQRQQRTITLNGSNKSGGSRLLQDALNDVVYKKSSANSTTKEKTSETSISSEGRLPIHLRLGVANVEPPPIEKLFSGGNTLVGKKRKSKQV